MRDLIEGLVGKLEIERLVPDLPDGMFSFGFALLLSSFKYNMNFLANPPYLKMNNYSFA